MKTCTKCGKSKPAEGFYLSGHQPCKDCRKVYARERYRASEGRAARLERQAARKAKVKAHRNSNMPEILREYRRRGELNPNTQAYRKAYRTNPEVKARRRKKDKARYAADPKFGLNRRMSAGIRHSLNGGKSGKTWESLAGYSLTQLAAHLEKQFLPGMNWQNMSEWHVDHILPLASFDFEKPEDADFKAAWALTNLRPLWALDNRVKHAKILTLI